MPSGAIANLSATLRWDLDDFKRGTAHIESAFTSIIGIAGKMADAVARAGQRMTLGLTLPLTGIAVLTTKAAADAEELQSAFNYTFGRMSNDMNRWAEDAGDAMGRSTQAMQKGALAFGQLFKAAAPTEQAAARMSQRFTELAQDAASFYNTDFDTAMGKIRSGLTGESEPLRDFGVFLSEAAVEAKGLEIGLISAGQEMNEYGKVMARAALIAESLSDAQGDIGRTSDSLANRVRKIKDDIQELAVEIGELLVPYAQKLAGVVERIVAWFKELPEGVKKAAIGFGVFLAVLGPLSVALSLLAITVLPIILVNMGKWAVVLSAVINPLGTMIVMAGKLPIVLAFISGALGKVLTLFLRLAGPVGVIITLLTIFGDDIAAGFRRFFDAVSRAVGPRVQEMFARLSELGSNLRVAFDKIADSPLGNFIGFLIKRIGNLIENFGYLLGYLTGRVLNGIIDVVNGIIDSITGMVDTVTKLLTGDWQGAWDAAVDTVGDAALRILGWVGRISRPLRVLLSMIAGVTGASLDGPAVPFTGFGQGKKPQAFAGLEQMLGTVENIGGQGGNYALAGDVKTSSRGGGRTRSGPSGPSAAELAERREAIRLEHELNVARERGDIEAIRSLERQIDLQAKIEDYERAGLSAADARIAANRDMAELDAVRTDLRMKMLGDMRVETEYQVAQLYNDQRHLTYLDDQEDLRRRIVDLQEAGFDLVTAEAIAADQLAQIEKARADNVARRLADEERVHEIELARLRGDSESSIRALQNEQWIKDRARVLEEDLSPREAMARAMREGAERERAHLQGTFRDAFRNGLQAALDGNLKGFFENWLKERSFNALSRVLDRLADRLADLVAGGGGGGGGLFSALGSLFGFAKGGGGGAPANLLKGTPYGFANGGSFQISGHPGIDKNLLSLNGNPIARVSHGEIVNVRNPANDSGGGKIHLYVHPSGEFDARVEGTAARVIAVASPHIASMGANEAIGRIGRAQSKRF